MDRKDFFREGAYSLVRAFFEGAREAGRPRPRDAGPEPILRPPGALPGEAFLERCAGSAACARVCPAEAIVMEPRAENSPDLAPRIRPAIAACVVCDDLSCMKACPTGALQFVPREAIRIGLAQVEPEACWAWSGKDETCSDCVDRCPMGPEALRIEARGEGRGPVVGEACVGCGVCELSCPVRPGAIRVFPLPGA